MNATTAFKQYNNCHRFDQALVNLVLMGEFFGESKVAQQLDYIPSGDFELSEGNVKKFAEAVKERLKPIRAVYAINRGPGIDVRVEPVCE
jgi:hypothetical protein